MEIIQAYGAKSQTENLAPLQIKRRNVLDKDVKINILYCGVCHSDIHTVRNDWGGSNYPVVPGHEIIGEVVQIGNGVSKFKVGDVVGVGCMVNSCRECSACKQHLEQFCLVGAVYTYNSPDTHLKNQQTYGGYSEHIVVDEHFVVSIPKNLKLHGTAPLLCAGITTYSPLAHWNIGKNDKVGIIGLGGLGHMGVKFAAALGAEVVLITRSPNKTKDAKKLGASNVLISTDEVQMKKHRNSFDFLLNTIPVGHNINKYINLLKIDATMVLVGAIEPLESFHGGKLIHGRKRIAGSLIGGIKETQEMLRFCGKHNITSDVELISIQDINTAYERILKSDVKYRFVIDMKSLK